MRFPKAKKEEQAPVDPVAPAPVAQPPIATTAPAPAQEVPQAPVAPVAPAPVAPQAEAPAMSPEVVEVPINLELINKKLNYLIGIGETLLARTEE